VRYWGESSNELNFGGRLSSGRVLNGLDRTPHTIMFILHEEDVNQFPMMAFFGGMFSEAEVSVHALDHVVEAPFPIRATINVAGHWKLMRFLWFSLSHVFLFCIRQCFGR
jgi:hypothetical protein